MADTKISGLTASGGAAGTNELAVNEAGTSKKLTVTQLATYLAALSETLTNKTLSSPVMQTPLFTTGQYIKDGNSNELLIFTTTASAVNEFTLVNGATGNAPQFKASGGDTDVSLNLVPKGAGVVQANGVTVVTISGTQTLTNKTLTTPIIASISNTGTLTLPTSSDTLVGRATTDTLTNKTLTTPVIASISNSGTITIPTGTDTLVGKATTDTLTNKTLTAPKIASGGFIADANGNELVIFTTTASAVNEITYANAATGGKPTITASGGDTDVSINLVPKGAGTVQVSGVAIVTTTATQTLTNKTWNGVTVGTAYGGTGETLYQPFQQVFRAIIRYPGYVVGPNSSLTLTPSTVDYVPIYFPTTTTITRLGVRVSTSVAAQLIKVALYSSSGGLPASRLTQWSATQGTDTAGEKEEVLGSPYVCAPGIYFLATISDTSLIVNGSGVVRQGWQYGMTNANQHPIGWFQEVSSGTTFPTTATPVGITSGSVPLVYFRID